GVTRYARKLGDTTTRLDRNEPALNSATPGDRRDTTTPSAMARDMRALVLGTALKPHSRDLLRRWLLLGCRTGTKQLRAGVPAAWRVGDKTGSGDHNTSNDIAVVWPRKRAPIVVAAYFTGSKASTAERDLTLPQVARIVSRRFA
ncbi:MAG TPA: serine hydrolase, partial [Candidatus Aquilonibacter sp.]